MEQQAGFSGGVALQVLCDVGVQIYLSFGSGGLQIFRDASGIFLDLLLDRDGTTTVGEMTLLDRKCLRNPQTSGCKENIQCLLLTAASPDEV
jgi:hypothetical protein